MLLTNTHLFTLSFPLLFLSAPADIPFRHVVIDSQGPVNPHVKAAGDINGDGKADVVAASSDGGPLVWYEAPGWKKHIIAPSGKWSCDARLVDMDGDGDRDLVISEWYTHNRMEWYENPLPDGNPAADPWKHHIIGSPRAHDIQVGDIDRDGRPEIVTRDQGEAGNRILIWKQASPGSWTQRVLECPAGEGLALADLTGDKRLDILIGGLWYETPEDILKDPWQQHTLADWHQDAVVKVADINRDGRLDVVLTRSEGPYRFSWFEAPADPGKGQWKEHVIDDAIAFAHGLAVGDMNRDGRPDIVVAEMHQSPQKRLMVFINEEGGLKWRKQVIATTGSHNLQIADLDGDGDLDIIGANWSGDYQPVEIWENLAGSTASER